MRQSWWIGILVVLGIGCTTEPVDGPSETALDLVRADSCETLRKSIAESMLEAMLHRYNPITYPFDFETIHEDDDPPPTPLEYSSTPWLEDDIDRPRPLLAYEDYFYAVQGEHVHILQSTRPETTAKLDEIELTGRPYGLMVQGDQLLVFESIEQPRNNWGNEGATRINQFDISNPAKPVLKTEFLFDGYLVTATQRDGELFLSIRKRFIYPNSVWRKQYSDFLELPEVNYDLPPEAMAAHREEVRAEAEAILRPIVMEGMNEIDMATLLPQWLIEDAQTGDAELEKLLNCEDIYLPPYYASASGYTHQETLFSMISLNIEQEDANAVGIFSPLQAAHSDGDDFYVAQAPISTIIDGEYTPTSLIYRFQRRADWEPSYMAAGAVEGGVFAKNPMTTHDGHLRVASYLNLPSATSDYYADRDYYSIITTMKELTPRRLNIVGMYKDADPSDYVDSIAMTDDFAFITALAETENIRGVDLTDPVNLTLGTEFSALEYQTRFITLPNDYLLAAGRLYDTETNRPSLTLELYNMFDPYAPERIDSMPMSALDLGGSPDTLHVIGDTIVLGVTDLKAQDGTFRGAAIFKPGPYGFFELGRINHLEMVADSNRYADRWYQSLVGVSLVRDDHVFSVSTFGMKVNALQNIDDEVARVLFWPK